MTSYLGTRHFYQKMFSLNVFQYEISYRTSFLRKFWQQIKFHFIRKIIGFIFSKNFKPIVSSSVIAHSIGSFILKNIKTDNFLIKMTCDEIWRHMSFYDVSQERKIRVLDSSLKRVKKGKIQIYNFRNRILIKFWFRSTYFDFFR